MKKILFISPHYPPSNMAAVHRSRLFVQHLSNFGWRPIILTVHEKYYEETLDWNLNKLLSESQKIEKVSAFRITKPRLIGDIGLRAFFQLRKKALQIVKEQDVDFVYIPIPSFYVSLIGTYLKRKTGVKYGIDYIDPWVHKFPGSDKLFSRHWFSTQLAKFLEPKAVRHASLITGVAEGYYTGVQKRNPHLIQSCIFGAMPYGGEESDFLALSRIGLVPYLFKKNNKLQLVYAGAMLPKAFKPLEAIFKSIKANPTLINNVEFHFIGTGKTPNDPNGYKIRALAEKYQLWGDIVFEYPTRIPYLDVLVHLKAADGIFILGSTEPHYTPSKSYQGVLSGKFILAVLHAECTAVEFIRSSGAGVVLEFNGENELNKLETDFPRIFTEWHDNFKKFSSKMVNREQFDKYSAFSVTSKLAELLEKACMPYSKATYYLIVFFSFY